MPESRARVLLERDADLATVDAAIDSVHGGDGALVVIQGPAGIGKTELLDASCERASSVGLSVAGARGAPLERDLAYGVVRQLFEPLLHRAADVPALLDGAAGLAAPVLHVPNGHAVDRGSDRGLAVVHGLYWLTANLADAGPLVVAVDDAHWSDTPSLRYLAYLARRLEGLPVLMLVALRDGEEPADAESAASIVSPDIAVPVRPDALSADAVAALARAALAAEPAAEFVTACRAATGGVPFLVHELLRALAADGVRPTAEQAPRIDRLGPDTVAHSTLLRLSRLGPAAVEVAQAVAVLGRHAEVRRVASLIDRSQLEVLAAVDRLAAAQVLRSERPLRFAHPILDAAVYRELGAGARSLRHAAAARLLAAEGADPEEVATHLLATEPAADPRAVATLRAAAATASARAAPTSSVAYLRRALAEPATDDRSGVLHELGRAEGEIGDPTAVTDLEEALRQAPDDTQRLRVAADLVTCHLFAGRWEQAVTCARSVPASGACDTEERTMLEFLVAGLSTYDVRWIADFDERRRELTDLARRSGAAARGLAVLLAAVSALRVEALGEVAGRVTRTLTAGLPALPEATMPQAVWALLLTDDVDAAAKAATRLRVEAHRRGSMVASVTAALLDVCVFGQRGELRPAAAELAGATDLIMEHGLYFGLPTALQRGLDAILERPGLAAVGALAENPELDAAFAGTGAGALLLEARGALRLAAGRTDDGIADLRQCGEIATALGVRHPLAWLWRSRLAIALAATDRVEAEQLADEELDLARATGLPRAEGIALRTVGLVRGGADGTALLRQSLAVLERAPYAALEQARTAVELGTALRRSGHRAAARDPLRTGLALAEHCGAQRLAEHAEYELRATGAKPRRRAMAGMDALTPSEARVARMAADGMANRTIAEVLFVSAKTVENQLGQVYRKLDVHTRAELGVVLALALAT